MSTKSDQLKLFVQAKVNILIVTETKRDSVFPFSQLLCMVIVNHIALTETGMGVGFLFIFEKTYQVNY